MGGIRTTCVSWLTIDWWCGAVLRIPLFELGGGDYFFYYERNALVPFPSPYLSETESSNFVVARFALFAYAAGAAFAELGADTCVFWICCALAARSIFFTCPGYSVLI